MKSIAVSISVLALLAFVITRVALTIEYNIYCGGHLKRAADANTIELAEQELSTALAYMDKEGWDKGGSTHLIFPHPKCDIGFWYENITSAKNELQQLDPDSTQLEKTNVLMKLRETILDGGESLSVTTPPGITVFPYQWLFCIWGWVSGVLAGVVVLVVICVCLDEC